MSRGSRRQRKRGVSQADPKASPTGATHGSGGALVGVVNGSVSTDVEAPRFWGVHALLVANGAAVVVALVRVLDGGTGVLDVFSGTPVQLLMIFDVICVAVGLLTRGPSKIFRRRGPAVDPPRAAAGGDVGSTRVVVVRRFRVQEITGQVRACVLRGDLAGDEVRHGDVVSVIGHRTRHGHIEAKRIDVLSALDGPVVSTVTARPSIALRLARANDLASTCVTGLVLLGLVAWLA